MTKYTELKNNDKTENISGRTLQDSQNDIRTWPDMPKREQIERASAFNTISKVLGKPLYAIPESIEVVRDLIAKADPAAGGIQANTWATRVSNMFSSLSLLGLHVMSGRCKTACSDDMRALLDRLPGMPHRVQLTPLTRWLIENGMSYSDLDQAASETFRADLKAHYRNDRYQKVYLGAINMFNRCRVEFSDFWPQTSIAALHNIDVCAFDRSEFSDAFNADVERLIADSLRPPLGRRSGRKPIRQSTADQRRNTIYRIASIIARKKNISPKAFQSLAEIVDPEAFDQALEFIMARVGREKTGDLHRVARTMHTIAKYHVGVSEDVLKEFANIRTFVYPGDAPASGTIEILRIFKNPLMQEKFVLGPEVEMARLKRKRRKTRNDAVNAQVATLWRVMTAAPLRSINAVTLCEGDNYLRFGTGRRQVVRIHVPGDEVKNEQDLNMLVPPEADSMVQTFFKHFQPLLGSSNPGQFCPGRGPGSKKATLLSQQLAKMTARVIGVRLTAHKWRHIVGYIFLLHNPGCYEPIRRLLGHKSAETTRRYYAFLLDEDAQEMIDETFDGIRRNGRLRMKRALRRREAPHA